MKTHISLWFIILFASAGLIYSPPGRAADQAADDAPSASNEYRTHFLEMCDLSVAEMDKPLVPFFERYRKNEDPKTHHYPFFMDAYAIRPLCVAYDMTGKKEYLDACTRWADMVVDYQQRMIPKGAYYLNYGKHRQPGKDKGWWFVADASTVASAVLAVAVRAEGEQREKYLHSVKSFARLVLDNYVGENGGVANGFWSFQGEWSISTACFGSFLFHLYAETEDPVYLKVALGCVDWMNGHDFRKSEPPAFKELCPPVAFYCFEFYAASLPYLEADSPRRKTAEGHIAEVLKWLAENQKGRGAKTDWNYFDKGKVHMTGNPYFMYRLARSSDRYRGLTAEADRELRYVDDLLFRDGKPRETDLEVWGLMTYGMMSYAERLSPGSMHRMAAAR